MFLCNTWRAEFFEFFKSKSMARACAFARMTGSAGSSMTPNGWGAGLSTLKLRCGVFRAPDYFFVQHLADWAFRVFQIQEHGACVRVRARDGICAKFDDFQRLWSRLVHCIAQIRWFSGAGATFLCNTWRAGRFEFFKTKKMARACSLARMTGSARI